MTDVLSIALSGLTAQKQRLAVTASNVANASTSGSVPQDAASAPAGSSVSTVYKPLQVDLTSIDGGGVRADVRERPDGYSLSYEPSSPSANADGFIAVPNVDLAQEAVTTIEIKAAFKANLAVLKTQDDMTKSLLDTLA